MERDYVKQQLREGARAHHEKLVREGRIPGYPKEAYKVARFKSSLEVLADMQAITWLYVNHGIKLTEAEYSKISASWKNSSVDSTIQEITNKYVQCWEAKGIVDRLLSKSSKAMLESLKDCRDMKGWSDTDETLQAVVKGIAGSK